MGTSPCKHPKHPLLPIALQCDPKKALNRLQRNSVEKNAAMRALGVTLIEHGDDFQEAREHAIQLAAQRGAHMVPSFHPDLLRGVSTYWWEF